MKRFDYLVTQNIGDPGSIKMRTVFPLISVLSKSPQLQYGVKKQLCHVDPVFSRFTNKCLVFSSLRFSSPLEFLRTPQFPYGVIRTPQGSQGPPRVSGNEVLVGNCGAAASFLLPRGNPMYGLVARHRGKYCPGTDKRRNLRKTGFS